MNYEEAQAAIEKLRELSPRNIIELYGVRILDVCDALQERIDALEKETGKPNNGERWLDWLERFGRDSDADTKARLRDIISKWPRLSEPDIP